MKDWSFKRLQSEWSKMEHDNRKKAREISQLTATVNTLVSEVKLLKTDPSKKSIAKLAAKLEESQTDYADLSELYNKLEIAYKELRTLLESRVSALAGMAEDLEHDIDKVSSKLYWRTQ